MNIPTEQIKQELQELDQEVRITVKTSRKAHALSVKESDKSLSVTFNPSKIRSENRLNELKRECVKSIILGG